MLPVELQRSLDNPHQETTLLAEEGLTAWQKNLPHDDVSDLIDLRLGTAVQWKPNSGWTRKDRPTALD